MFFFNFYVTRAFSIPTINTIELCVIMVELSEDLEVRMIQVRDPITIILSLFLYVPNEYNYFYSSEFPTNNICNRRESRALKFLLFVGNINRKIYLLYLDRKLRSLYN